MDNLSIFRILYAKINNCEPFEIKKINRENDILVTKLGRESWKSLSSFEKQKERKLFLSEDRKYSHNIVSTYYENLIVVYDLLLILLEKIEILLNKINIHDADIGLLRIFAMSIIEKEFIDDYRVPKRHIGITVFSQLANEFHERYPDLNLKEFSKAYSNMYRYWPGKQNINYEESINQGERNTIFNILSERLNVDGKFPAEAHLMIKKSQQTNWENLNTYKKQDKRRETWMRFKDNPESLISSPHYEKMILFYDRIIDILERLRDISKDENSIKNAEIGHLRIIAILQIEKDYMDEDIIPKHHIPPHFIATLAEEYNDTYPDLNLSDLSKAYTEMYELWLDKPENNLKTS